MSQTAQRLYRSCSSHAEDIKKTEDSDYVL